MLARVIAGLGLLALGSQFFSLSRDARALQTAPAVTKSILAGEVYPSERLEFFEQFFALDNSVTCDVERLRGLAAIALARLEATGQHAGKSAEDLNARLEALLACSPQQGFFWLVKFQLSYQNRGAVPETMAQLDNSYGTSPNEGWVALARNQLAFRVIESLPIEHRRKAENEFVRLLKAGVVDNAVDVLRSQSGPRRAWAAQTITNFDPGARFVVLRLLEKAGVPDIWQPMGIVGQSRPLLRTAPAEIQDP